MFVRCPSCAAIRTSSVLTSLLILVLCICVDFFGTSFLSKTAPTFATSTLNSRLTRLRPQPRFLFFAKDQRERVSTTSFKLEMQEDIRIGFSVIERVKVASLQRFWRTPRSLS